MVFSPIDLGLPVNRSRRYTLVFPSPASPLYGKVLFNKDFFQPLVFRRLLLKGSVYLKAPQNLVDGLVDQMAEAKGLPPRPPGHHYGFQAAMPTGERMRMLTHLEKVQETMLCDLDVNAEIAQNPGYSKSMSIVPTLVRNSVIYNFQADREFLVLELLASQGLPYFLPDEHPFTREMPGEFLNELAKIPDRKLKCICGNAMNMAQVGSVIAMIFMFATRQEL